MKVTTKENMKLSNQFIKRLTAFFLLICVLMFVVPGAVGAQTVARAGLLEDMQIRPGTPVEIPIEIENVVDLYGIDIEIEFDPTFWEFEDVDPRREGINPATGTFLDPGMTLFNNIYMDEGKIHLVISQVNPSEAKSGSGILLVLYATALKSGTTSFEVVKVEASTRDGIGIEIEGVDGEVSIESDAPEVTTTPIPVTDPTQIIIIPTYVPPTATPKPTSTPQPTATMVVVAAEQGGQEPGSTAADGQIDATSESEEPAGVEQAQPAGTANPTSSTTGGELTEEGNDGNTGLLTGVILAAVILAAAGYFIYNRNHKTNRDKE